MVAALLLLVAAATPVSSDEARAAARAVVAGDWGGLARLRVALIERGDDTSVGPLALADEISRVARCLALPPIPRRESPELRAARTLLRLEALRISRRRTSGGYPDDPHIDRVLALAAEWSRPAGRAPPGWVAWPLSTERWPGEALEPVIAPSRCARPEPAAAAGSLRARDDAAWLAGDLIDEGAPVPHALRAPLLLTALVLGAPLSASATVAAWLDGGEPRVASAARVRLARRGEALGDVANASALYRAVISDPTATPEEDGWARARLVQLLATPAEVVEVARGARGPRPNDRAALRLAEGRALYSAGDLDGLERLGRASLPALGSTPYDAAFLDLLTLLALGRDPDRAIAWAESLGPRTEREARLDALAIAAIEHQRWELASAVYDDLRRAATEDRRRGGAPAAARMARWIAGRARVEHARGDAETFAAFVAELVTLAQAEADRPLARTAPHRELAALAQALLGPLTEAREDPRTGAYARALLDAIDALLATTTRWSSVLIGYRAPIAALAGDAAREPAGAGLSGKRAPARKLRSVGLVTLPRLPVTLPAPDDPPPAPPAGSFWVHLEPRSLAVVAGLPWR